ncbi:helix-turn-helix domain-containing protein [Pseudomonas moorei]|nr:helix-turn-helix domain-containing protein [Pseudomonas moorei]
MSVRNALATVLRLLRKKRGLTQHDFSAAIAQSHISHIENAKTSPTLDLLDDLCGTLSIHSVTFMALVQAAQSGRTAGEVLEQSKADLEAMSLLDKHLNAKPELSPHPRITQATEVWCAVQKMKSQGHSRAETVKALGVAKTTVQRYWNRPIES